MRSALIGSSGFVGGTLLAQTSFDDHYRSTNIEAIRGARYELLVCAGAPAAKWKANQDPAADLANLRRLMDCLRTVRAGEAILISTIDVYPDPAGVDEGTPIDPEKNTPYGRHRYWLEQFFTAQFPRCRRIRLPGLFGAGLRKNFLFDLLRNPSALPLTHRASRFQFYDMSRLWDDIGRVRAAGLTLANFATEPVAAGVVAGECFGERFVNETERPPVRYDMQTRHAAVWGAAGRYLMPAPEVLRRVSAFARAERAH
jgi:nucleoside-diphosphate-sugar epimerase